MALRICLVGLVVARGFELPSGEQVSARVQSGWNCVLAADEVGSYRVPSEPLAAPTWSDEKFAGIVDRMALSFAAELARNERLASVVHARPEIEIEEWSFEPLEDSKPVIATSSGRVDRLMSAVKLTRRAASAWAELFASVEESGSPQSGSSATEEGGTEADTTEESPRQPVTR